MNLQEFRQKYPEYNDLSDDDLAYGLYKKEYSDLPQDQVYKQFGIPLNEKYKADPVEKTGNIDLTNRPQVKNADGSISTVRSISVNIDGEEVLIPTVSDEGTILSTDEAVQRYKQTGKHLGKFKTPEEATSYAKTLSKQQGDLYGEPKQKSSLASDLLMVPEAVKDLAAGVPRTALNLASMAAAGVAGGNYDNPVSKWTDEKLKEFEDWSSDTFVSAEEKARMGIVGKTAEVIGTIPGVVLSMPLQVLVYGGKALSDVRKATKELGASNTQANLGGIAATAGAIALLRVPLLGKTLTEAAGYGAGTNILQGMVVDGLVTAINYENPEIHKLFDPLDYEKRGYEALFGAGFSSAGFKLRGHLEKHKEKQLRQQEEFMSPLLGQLEANLKDLNVVGRKHNEFLPGESLNDALKRTENSPNAKVVDILDLYAEAPDGAIRPYQKQHARMLLQFLDKANLADISVVQDLVWKYNPDADKIHLNNLNRKKTDDFLHEVSHGITSHIFTLGEIIDANVNNFPGGKVPKHLQGLHDNYLKFSKLHEETYKRFIETDYGKDLIKPFIDLSTSDGTIPDFTKLEGMRKWIEKISTDPHENEYFDNIPGVSNADARLMFRKLRPFKNVHEFAADFMSNYHGFSHELSKIKLRDDEYTELGHDFKHGVKYLWEPYFRAIEGEEVSSTKYEKYSDSHKNLQRALLENFAGLISDNVDLLRYRKKWVDPVSPTGKFSKSALDSALDAAENTPLELYLKNFATTAHQKIDEQNNGIIMKKMAHILRNSLDDTDAKIRLIGMLNTPSWHKFVLKNYKDLWENRFKITETWGLEKDFGNQELSKQKFQHDPRTVEQYMDKELKKFLREGMNSLTEAQDMKSVGGKHIFGTPQLRLMVKENAGGKIARFFMDKMIEYTQLGEIQYQFVNENYLKDYKSLDAKGMKEVMNMATMFSSTRFSNRLSKLGLKWPTEAIVKSVFKDASPEVVKAYVKMGEGNAYLHDLLAIANRRRNIYSDPLEFIPAYMPAVHRGSYKTLVQHTTEKYELDANGQPITIDPVTGHPVNPERTSKIVYVIGRHTRHGIKEVNKILKTGKYNSTETTPDGKYIIRHSFAPQFDPQSEKHYYVAKSQDVTNTVFAGLQEHLTAFHNQLRASNDIMKTLMKIEADSATGIIKETLERQGIGGFEGEFKGEKYRALFGELSAPTNERKFRDTYTRYAKNVTEYYKNTMFAEEVFLPLMGGTTQVNEGKNYYGHLFQNTPNLQKYIGEAMYNFTGENINHFPVLDVALRSILGDNGLGINPFIYRDMVRGMRDFLSLSKLRANPVNYVANSLQFVNVITMLNLVNAARAADGLPQISVTKAMKNAAGVDDKDTVLMKMWAKSSHILEPQLEYQMRTNEPSKIMKAIHYGTLGEFASMIEGGGRERSFEIAYQFMKEVYGDDRSAAYSAAQNIMELTMVNYNRSDRPLMYQNMGILGESLAPFAVFRNAYIGNTILIIKAAMGSVRNMQALKPVIAASLVGLATAGVMGVPILAEYNAIVDFINDHPDLRAMLGLEDSHLPHLQDMLVKGGMPDALTFGLLSVGFQADISASMATPQFTALDSFPLIQFTTAVVPLLGKTVPKMMAEAAGVEFRSPTTAKDWMGPVKQFMPSVVHPWIDQSTKAGIMPQGGRMGMYATKPEALADISNDDVLINKFTGKKSLPERKARMAELSIQKSQKIEKEEVTRWIQAGIEATIKGKPETYLTYRRLAVEKGRMTVQQYDTLVRNGLEGRGISPKDKRLMDIGKPRNYEFEMLRQQYGLSQ